MYLLMRKLSAAPDRVGCAVEPVEMVLVRYEDDRCFSEPGCKNTAIHGVAHHTIEMMITDQTSDNQSRSYGIRNQPLRRPERLFQAEEAVFPFKTDFAVDPVQVVPPVLKEEIIGFAIPGKLNGMSLLLQVMTEMETPGGVPESLTADNKKDLHGSTCLKAYVPINNEISAL